MDTEHFTLKRCEDGSDVSHFHLRNDQAAALIRRLKGRSWRIEMAVNQLEVQVTATGTTEVGEEPGG